MLAKLARPGFRRSISGHLFEALDEQGINALHRLSRGGTPLMRRFPAHNEIGLDAEYIAETLADGLRYAQHKATVNPQQLAAALTKTPAHAKDITELVVGRGVKSIATQATHGAMKVRESATSLSDLKKAMDAATTLRSVAETGVVGGMRAAARKAPGAAVVGAGFSVVGDVRRRRAGENIADGAMIENAAWASGEAIISTVAGSGAVAAAAPLIAAGGTALAASSLAGTTAAASALLATGPVGVAIVTGMAAGVAVRHLRRQLRSH